MHRPGDSCQRGPEGVIINVKQDDYKSMIKFQKELIALAIQSLESPHNGFKNAKSNALF
jgi:hypothetical protein